MLVDCNAIVNVIDKQRECYYGSTKLFDIHVEIETKPINVDCAWQPNEFNTGYR